MINFGSNTLPVAHQTQSDALRQSASELVNQVFYGTMLRQVRESQNHSLFGNGPGGQTFIRQLDAELIKRMSSTGDAPLADILVQKLSGRETPSSANAAIIELDRAGQAARRQITESLANKTWRTV